MSGPRNRADCALSNLVRQGGQSRCYGAPAAPPAPGQPVLPPPNPGILDSTEAPREWPLWIVLAVGVAGAFGLYLLLCWLGGVRP